MKILFYMNQYRMQATGLENSAVKLCRGLLRHDHEVHVLCQVGEASDGVKVHLGLEKADGLLSELQPDLTIDWGFLHEADIHRLGGGTHSGFIQMNIDAYRGIHRKLKIFGYKKKKHKQKIAWQQKLLRREGAFILANSQQTANMAIADGANPDRVTVKHQAVDTERFHPKLAEEHRVRIREEWGLTDDDVVFLFVAHNHRLKNLDLLYRVFLGYMPQDAKLVVASKYKAKKYGSKNIINAGITDQPEQFYVGADVLVHPSYFDSCANVVIEAMSCGLPVLVSNTSGINEIVRDGCDGRVLTVRGKDSDVELLWEDAMKAFMDEKLRTEWGASARETAEKNDYEDFLNWFDDYLKQVSEYKQAAADAAAAND